MPPPQALEDQYSPSRWSPRLGRDTIIDAHIATMAAGEGLVVPGREALRAGLPLGVLLLGQRPCSRLHVRPPAATQRARASVQTALHIPYGDGDREKLDIYFPPEPYESK